MSVRGPPRFTTIFTLFLHYLRKVQQKEGRACSPEQCHDIAEMFPKWRKYKRNAKRKGPKNRTLLAPPV